MEITYATRFCFNISRLLGYAPYIVNRDDNGKILKIRLSIVLCIYSIVLNLSLVTLTVMGIVNDAKSNPSLRMRSATSKIVTGFDINIVALTCLTGMISGISGVRETREMTRRLQEADKILSIYNGGQSNNDKRNGIIKACCIFALTFSILGLDSYKWILEARKIKERNAKAVDIFHNVYYLIPFWTLYVFLIGLHVQFMQSSNGIGNRYKRLNCVFKRLHIKNDFVHSTQGIVGKIVNIRNDYGFRKYRNGIIKHEYSKNDENINRLAFVHETLGKSMVCLSSAFGLTLLVMMSSCLLHFVATAYFFFLEIFGDMDPFYTSLLFIWLGFHFLRILTIVEPCHLTAIESHKTIKLVCDLLRKNDNSECLKTFWQQLVANETYFSACGICKIDRQLLTSLLGAVATYLVILLQFERADDHDDD